MKKRLYGRTALGAIAAAFAMTLMPMVSGATSQANGAAEVKLNTIKASHLASLRSDALKSFNRFPGNIQPGPASSWLSRVNPDSVNMVTNRHEKTKQREVSINGKTYYSGGESYAYTLKHNLSLRYAADPLTNKKIDKSEALIYADASGRVHYFESEESFRSFIALAGSDSLSSAN